MPLRLRLLVAATVATGGAILIWHLRSAGDLSAGGAAVMAAASLSGLLIVELSSVSAGSVSNALVPAGGRLVLLAVSSSVVAVAIGWSTANSATDAHASGEHLFLPLAQRTGAMA